MLQPSSHHQTVLTQDVCHRVPKFLPKSPVKNVEDALAIYDDLIVKANLAIDPIGEKVLVQSQSRHIKRLDTRIVPVKYTRYLSQIIDEHIGLVETTGHVRRLKL